MCEGLIWATQRLSHMIQPKLPLVAKYFMLEPIANNLRVKAHYGDPLCMITFCCFFGWSLLNLNLVKTIKELHNVFSYYGKA
jgi:hypothetical protein